ncbi:MAG: histidine kinase dimerization/phospho-acceptor domain-containing protein [Planctomycetota bacterium]|jgi:signal transduction histidine kinase
MAGELQQKIASLEHLSRIRIAFVANLRHELKTPLTLIKGIVETLDRH